MAYALAACGGGEGAGEGVKPGEGGSQTPSSWEGFTRIPSLGRACTASMARNAREHYSALTWIPCASGAAGCSQLKWDGALSWRPTGDDDFLEFYGQVALDGSGAASRLLVVKRYPRGDSYQGLPFEAVAYDLEDGAPLVAFRNRGDEYEEEDDGTVVISSGGRDCELEPVLTDGGIWIVGNPSGSEDVVAGRLAFGGDSLELRPIDATVGVLDGTRTSYFGDERHTRLVGSDAILGLEEPDGRIIRVGADPALDLATYGPDVRVWLAHALDEHLVAVQPGEPDERHVLLQKDGRFTDLLGQGTFVRFDGVRVVLLQAREQGLVVWSTAMKTGAVPAGEPQQGPTLPNGVEVTSASLANGKLVLLADQYEDFESRLFLYTIDIDAGTFSERELEDFEDLELVGHDGTHAFLIDKQDRATFRRYALE
jgi:hypothetical protein